MSTDKQAGATGRSYRDRTGILRGIGGLLILAGLGFALLGPVEIYCFYLFSEGGRFHYQGFGFGSLMFGNIAIQVAGYYLIGALLLVLGHGHLRLKRWARKLTMGLLAAWLVAGIPLLLIVALMLFSAKELSVPATGVIVALLGLSYFVLPRLLTRFYASADVKHTLEAHDSSSGWLESVPTPILTVVLVSGLCILGLHALVLFNGLFPAFGTFVSGLEGICLLDAAMMCLALLSWGLLRLRSWAWWGSLLYFVALGSSSVITLARHNTKDLLFALNLPARELEFLGGLKVSGMHLAGLVAIPLLAMLGLLVRSRRHFE